MKATMNAQGVITLKAETSLEGFALARWAELALIPVNDMERREACHWRCSMLIVDGTPPEARS